MCLLPFCGQRHLVLFLSQEMGHIYVSGHSVGKQRAKISLSDFCALKGAAKHSVAAQLKIAELGFPASPATSDGMMWPGEAGKAQTSLLLRMTLITRCFEIVCCHGRFLCSFCLGGLFRSYRLIGSSFGFHFHGLCELP